MRNPAFVLIAGKDSDAETERRLAAGEQLVNIQISQHNKGLRSARLAESIYGWSVRSGSGLDNFQLLYRSRQGDGSIEAAIAWGVAWANQDPEHREFYALKEEVKGVDLSKFR